MESSIDIGTTFFVHIANVVNSNKSSVEKPKGECFIKGMFRSSKIYLRMLELNSFEAIQEMKTLNKDVFILHTEYAQEY